MELGPSAPAKGKQPQLLWDEQVGRDQRFPIGKSLGHFQDMVRGWGSWGGLAGALQSVLQNLRV